MTTRRLAAVGRWIAVLVCMSVGLTHTARANGTANDLIHIKVVEDPKSKAEFLDLPTLLKFGLNVGAAAAFFTPVELGEAGANQRNTAVSAMPYLAFTPSYWAPIGAVTREYCTKRALTLSSRTAQEEANAYAMNLARKKYEADVKNGCFTERCRVLNDGITSELYKSFDQVYRDATLRYVGWDVELPGRCTLSWLGFYFGIPLSYSSNFGGTKLDVRPKVSLGVAILPTPYVNLLIGATAIDAVIPAAKDATGIETSPARLSGSWQLTFAIGGTVDIVAKLFSLGK